MKPKTAIILCAVLIVCIGLMLVGRTGLFDTAPDEATPAIFDPVPSKLTGLTIIDDKGNVLQFARTKDDWQIVQPIKAKADNWSVNQVAEAVGHLTGDNVEDQNLTNDMTGLDNPLYVVKILDDKGASYTLHVGNKAPMMGSAVTRTYVRIPKGQDYVVAEDLAEKLGRAVGQFQDKTIMGDIRSDQVVRVTVSGKENYELLRRGYEWDFVSPFGAKAIRDKVDSLVRRATGLEAKEIVSIPPGAGLSMFGLEEGKEVAVLRLTLKPERPPTTTPATTKAVKRRGRSYAIAFGQPRQTKKMIYARRLDKDDVFLLDASALEDLQPKMIDLRVKQIIDVRRFDVTKIDLDLPGGPIALSKEGGTWQMVKPFAGKASPRAVGDMIDKVNSLKATGFRDGVVALAALGLDPPKSRIVMTLTGQTQRPTLLIGNTTPSGDRTFVKSILDPAVAVVRSSDLKGLPSKATDLWNTTLLRLPENSKVVRLVMRRPDDTYTVRRDEKGKWLMLSPIPTAADTANINSIIDRLRNLSATEIVFLGEEAPRAYTRAKGIIVTAVTASSPATTGPAKKRATLTHVLNILKIKDNVFAMQPGRKVVAIGKCPPTLYDDMLAELRDRNVWQIDPEKITGIKIVAGQETTQIVLEGKVWKYRKDPYVNIDPNKVKSFLEGIKAGKAERFAHYKTKDLRKYRLDKPWFTLDLTDEANKVLRIVVSHIGAHETNNRYATASSTEGVLVISADLAGKMAKKLKDFKEGGGLQEGVRFNDLPSRTRGR